MASVWIARHTGKHGFEKFVAVKTVLPKFAADARFQQMFQDETRIASRIEHPNVAQILDVGEQHEITYLVMEYVDGESLSALHRTLAKKSLRVPPGVVLRIMADVCGGLHTAHELREADGELLGVVHRDVSPQNVLVSTKGIAKLIDFGIAKARDRIVGDTSSGQVKGKIRYMAPEQALGGAIDRRADVWAVGAVLYHLLSGKPPYDGENDVQTLMVLTSGRPPVPLPAEVHPAIAAVVKRALSVDVDHRFATAAEVQQALEDAMIEAKIVTHNAAIAAFLVEHVAERTKKRKAAIAVGVKAAAERDRYAEIMRSNLKAAAGVSGTNVNRPSEAPGSRSGVGSYSGAGTPGGLGSIADGPSRNGIAPNSGSSSGPGSASNSNGTLGLAVMDVGSQRPLVTRTVAIVGVAAGAVLGVAGLILVLTHHSAERVESNALVEAPIVASAASAPETAVTTAPATWTAATVEPIAPAADAKSVSSSTMAATPPRANPAINAAVNPTGGMGAAPAPAVRPIFRPATRASHTKTRIDDGF